MDNNDSKWKIPPFLWIPLLIFFSCVLFFVDVFPIQNKIFKEKLQIMQQPTALKEDHRGFLIKTKGCRIPNMELITKEIKKFIFKEQNISCNNDLPAIVESNTTSIFLINSSLISYGINDTNDVSCCYTTFWREPPEHDHSDNNFKFAKKCIEFKESITIEDEFIKVTCNNLNTNKIFYTDTFSFVPLKQNLSSTENKRKLDHQPLNVLVIGLDAVSRLNFHRQMPKTSEYLRNMSVIELFGYNKVADNTFPNLIPVLVGVSENELDKLYKWNAKKYFDIVPFIWNDYKENGYVTAFGEDSSWMGIFNYQRKGFKKQPTDYHYGYFNRLSETEIGNSHRMNVDRCVGSRKVYKNFLNYIRDFCVKMYSENLPYFAFYWAASLSHDFLNTPNLGDDDYFNFFKYMYENEIFNNTAVIFMSDHGIRWGDIRQTYQGRLEERLPFVFIHLPEWYKIQFSVALYNLMRNARRLTTPFDLHETFKDLLKPFDLNTQYLNKRNSQISRGYSLFAEIPTNRTCEAAAISNHWCTCQLSLEIDVKDPTIIESSEFAIEYMNKQLRGYAQCAKLSLEEIKNARSMTHDQNAFSKIDSSVQDYMITLRTTPGNGIFETTIRRHSRGKLKPVFEVVGSISRLNLYGKQSSCITDFHLKLYCFCTNLFY